MYGSSWPRLTSPSMLFIACTVFLLITYPSFIWAFVSLVSPATVSRNGQVFPILGTSPCSHFLLELTTSHPPPSPPCLSKFLKRRLHSLFQLPDFQLTPWAGFHFSALYWSTLHKAAKSFLKPNGVDLVISFLWIFLRHLTPLVSNSWKLLCSHCALFLFTLLSNPSFFV